MKEEENNNNQVFALGCRLNAFEAELIKEQAKKAGVSNTIFVNSCTVTSEAHKQSMQLVRKLKRENPNANIVVTGCGAEIDPNSFANMKEVSKVIGNKDKFSLNALKSEEKIILGDLNSEEDFTIPQIQGFENRTRAFIQIQQGCDHRCTFCIIATARGKSKSLPQDTIIQQIKQAVDFGHKEVVLTGVDISSWNRDALVNSPSRIGFLCKEILKEVPNLPRLRLSSLDPAVVDSDILDLLKHESRFMPHIHLSLQAMNNSVLKNMGRRHSRENAIAWINDLRTANKNVAIGADMICGFPRETDEQFEDTYSTIKDLKIPFLHVFPYSTRKNTIAEKMKEIPMDIRKKRAKILSGLAEQIKVDFFKAKLNTVEEVLCESNNMGYTKDYSLVKILGNAPQKEIINVEIVDYNQRQLIAKVVDNGK
ncbi:MAG: tRNA (N(6)-L-threonylcarbamoyladenosine(37)-C(2))-methylthiotransferase MtaB [Alphaproteobacteria bacterium]|jgi:threonylcarbamoyladenosine tRNA methylthiotransferase MtaB|nr:tRNA (N(6)-L-threonylcarbamoyladenosine(37)-C(2))-methylthiotransferase MtaB [Alphaproteobacteria bacterium]